MYIHTIAESVKITPIKVNYLPILCKNKNASNNNKKKNEYE